MLQYEEAWRAKSCMQQERNAAVWLVDLSAGTLKLGYYCEHNLPASYFCSNTLSTRRRRSLLAAPHHHRPTRIPTKAKPHAKAGAKNGSTAKGKNGREGGEGGRGAGAPHGTVTEL